MMTIKRYINCRFIKKSVFFCLLIGVLQSCVFDSTDHCPGNGSLILNVSHRYNTANIDQFQDDVTKMDFFIYDQNGILVRTITDAEGPFTNGYSVRIENLPEGNYQVVSLGNIYSDNEIRNVEQLSTALISLVASNTSARSETSKGVVLSTPTTLFHALTDVVNVKTLREVTHSTDLVRNTNDVTVTLNWKDAMGNYCTNSSHETETVVYLEGNNGESDFGNNLLGNRLLTYHTEPLPSLSDDKAEVRAWIRTMRLMAQGSTVRLVVKTKQTDGSETTVYSNSLTDLIRLTGQYGTQESIDRESDYQVDVTFRCTDNNDETWTAMTIYINGWLVKLVDTEI